MQQMQLCLENRGQIDGTLHGVEAQVTEIDRAENSLKCEHDERPFQSEVSRLFGDFAIAMPTLLSTRLAWA